MNPTSQLLPSLVALLVLAKLLEAPFRKAHLHSIPAHVLAGIILGPYVLGYVYPSPELLGVSYLGLLLLMFYTGLTTDFRELRRHGLSIVVMGGLGVLTTFGLVFTAMRWMDFDLLPSLFIAAALSNTATETVAAIVAKKGDPSSRSLLVGASFADDVMAVYIIGLLSSLTRGTIDFYDLGLTALKTGIFLFAAFALSSLLVKRLTIVYKLMSTDYFWFASISVILALALSLVSRLVGLSELIGAYLAGIIISRGREFHDPFLRTRIAITEFISDFAVVLDVLFIPLFFTYIGVAFKPGAVDIRLFLILLAMATAGKVIGTTPIAYYSLRDKRKSLAVGLAMCGRGSLETALLKIGLDSGLINDVLFNTTLTVALATTILAPLFYVVTYKSS